MTFPKVHYHAPSHEIGIVWEEDISKLRFVREDIDPWARWRQKPVRWSGAGRRVGYSVLAKDAPNNFGFPSCFIRRVFWVRTAEFEDYKTGAPLKAVDPYTVAPGVPGRMTERAWGRPFEEDNAHINGLPLPSVLLTLMNAGRWKRPDDLAEWNRVFPVCGSDSSLYKLETMQRVNKDWLDEQNPLWFGVPDALKAPGDIDPRLSVLIGDLGTGYDQPIALDYRASIENPRVLTLEWSEVADKINLWSEIAPHVTAFAEWIGL